jgi:hypothetical protein
LPQTKLVFQAEVIRFAVDAVRAEAFNAKTLFLFGSYTIGKERLFLEVARQLSMKVELFAHFILSEWPRRWHLCFDKAVHQALLLRVEVRVVIHVGSWILCILSLVHLMTNTPGILVWI